MSALRARTSAIGDDASVASRGPIDFDSPASQLDSAEILDEDEQLEIVQGFEAKAALTSKLYRASFSSAAVVISLVFFYFAYEREDFGEASVGRERAQIVHLVTAFGFLLCAVRALRGRRPFFSGDSAAQSAAMGVVPLEITHRRPPSILSPEQVANLFGTGAATVSETPKKPLGQRPASPPSLSGSISEEDDSNISVAALPQHASSPADARQQQQSPTLSVATTASAVGSPHLSSLSPLQSSSSSSSLGSQRSSSYVSPSLLIQELQKAALKQGGLSTGRASAGAVSLAGTPLGALVSSGRNVDAFFLSSAVIALLTLVSWWDVMYANYQHGFVERATGDLKLHLFVFPWVLPFFVAAVEYALKLTSSTSSEIQDLYGLMYRHKRA